MQEFTDSELLRVLLTDEKRRKAAMEELHKRWHVRIHAYFFSKVRVGMDANDLTQQFYMRLMRKRDLKVPDIKNAEAYLLTIARNLVTDYYKDRKRHHSPDAKNFDDKPANEHHTDNAKHFHYDHHFLAIVRVAFGQLSVDEQEILVLRKHCDLSSKTVSQFYGKSVGAIDKRVNRVTSQWKRISIEMIQQLAIDRLSKEELIALEHEVQIVENESVNDRSEWDVDSNRQDIKVFLNQTMDSSARIDFIQRLVHDGRLCDLVAQELMTRYDDDKRRQYLIYLGISNEECVTLLRDHSYTDIQISKPFNKTIYRYLKTTVASMILLTGATILILNHHAFSKADYGLVVFYPFNGNTDNETTNEHHGIASLATPTVDRFGKLDRAYYLPSRNSAITTSFPGIGGSAPRTISFWARRNSSSTTHFIFVMYGHIRGTPEIRGSAFGCYLYFDDSLTVGIDVQQGAIRYDALADDNNWHHYAYVVPKQSKVLLKHVKLYQDGILMSNAVDWWSSRVVSENTIINTLPSENLTIETRSNSYVDDIRVYDRDMSDDEILQLYHENGWEL